MPFNDSYSMTDRAIAREIGQRIEQIRLEKNISQKDIAENIGITIKTYRNLIDGGGKFETMLGVLRALGHLELVDAFIPEATFSPLELVKMRGKKRLRASGGRKISEGAKENEELDW